MNTRYEKFDCMDARLAEVKKSRDCRYEVFTRNELNKASSYHIIKQEGLLRGLACFFQQLVKRLNGTTDCSRLSDADEIRDRDLRDLGLVYIRRPRENRSFVSDNEYMW